MSRSQEVVNWDRRGYVLSSLVMLPVDTFTLEEKIRLVDEITGQELVIKHNHEGWKWILEQVDEQAFDWQKGTR